MKNKVILFLMLLSINILASDGGKKKEKPSIDKVMQILKEGNKRFVEGKSIHPHLDKERVC